MLKMPNCNQDKKSEKPDKPTCKFHAKGKCRHEGNCRFSHPKICHKFRAFGLKIHNNKGCENKNCSYFHPNACRDSLKHKTCPRADCRFYHLKGTKHQTQQEQRNVSSQNRFEVLAEKNSTSKNSKQVFHKEPPSEEITLADLMKEIMSIKKRQDVQEKYQTSHRSDSPDWRKSRSQKRNTQEQKREWDSQRRDKSQRSRY